MVSKCTAEANIWAAYLSMPTTTVAAGDNLLLVFWTKGISDMKGTYGAIEVDNGGSLLKFYP